MQIICIAVTSGRKIEGSDSHLKGHRKRTQSNSILTSYQTYNEKIFSDTMKIGRTLTSP